MNEDIYANQNALLKEALKFYANKNNYISGMCNQTQISVDDYGSQARFALKQLDDVEIINQKIEEEYISEIIGSISTVDENPINLINVYKNIQDDNDF